VKPLSRNRANAASTMAVRVRSIWRWRRSGMVPDTSVIVRTPSWAASSRDSGPLRLVLLGAPGSGKGTQGEILADRFGAPHIASGELLRHAARSDVGRQIAGYLDRGELVPDDLVVALMGDVLGEGGNSRGYILDGFPRNRAQAERLEALAPPEAVVYLALPDEVARQRMARRATQAGRNDDADRRVIERRLRVFHAETEPLLDFYRERGLLTTVDASQAPEDVGAAILEATRSDKGRPEA
jgi:adenylate kinase